MLTAISTPMNRGYGNSQQTKSQSDDVGKLQEKSYPILIDNFQFRRENDGNLHEMVHELMQITELARQANTSTDRIRYLERKGFVRANLRRIKVREVRDYTDEEVEKIRLIIKFFRAGFNYDMAYEKALEESRQPRLV